MYSVFGCPGTLLLIIIIIIIVIIIFLQTQFLVWSQRAACTLLFLMALVWSRRAICTVLFLMAELCRRRVPCVRAVGIPSRSKTGLYGRPRLAA